VGVRDAFLQKVGAEFWKQTKQAMLFLALFMVVSTIVRGRMPWSFER
jgi:hypothetical protein